MPEDMDYLLLLLNSTKVSDRKKAITGIEKSGSRAASKNLIGIMEKERDESIRSLTAKAIGTLGISEAADVLLDAVSSGSEEVAYFASQSLAQIKSAELVKKIGELMKAQDEKSDRIFYWLTQTLFKIGRDSIPLLVDLLDTSSWTRRRILGDALVGMGSECEQTLINGLCDENVDKRFWCATILGKVGGNRAVEELIKYVDDPDRDVRSAVTTALGEIGNNQAIEFLKKSLKSPKKEVRHRSVEVLGKFGEEIVESLVESLSDDYWYVRDAACQALARLGKKVIPYLENVYSTGNEDIRISAIKALAAIGSDAMSQLIKALADKYEPICHKAADAIIKIGPSVIDQLLAVYRKESSSLQVRHWIIYIFGQIEPGGAGHKVLPYIVEALKSNDIIIRYAAACALKNFKSSKVVSILIELLSDIHEEIREKAMDNLIGMPKESIPALIGSFNHENWIIRKNTAIALGKIGRESIPHLLKVLQSGDEDSRYWAIRAMGYIGIEACEPLLHFLNDNSWQVRKNAADSLVEIGEPVIKPLISHLAKAQSLRESNLFYWSDYLLTRIGEPSVRFLSNFLHNSNENMRILAVSVIGKNPSHPESAAIIKDALQDESFDVRKCAAQWAGFSRSHDVLDDLIDFYEKNEQSEECIAPILIESISRIESEKTLDFLYKMLRSPKWVTRLNAVRAFSNISDKLCQETDLEKIVPLLNDDVQPVAEGVARLLASMRLEKAQINVIRLLKERRFEEIILDALAKNSSFKSRDVIVGYLKNREKNIRVKAAYALGACGNKSNIPGLTALLNDEFIVVRTAALFAINQINGRSAERKEDVVKPFKAEALKSDEQVMSAAEQYYQTGLFHSKNGEYEKALNCYQNAIASDPFFVQAYCKIGLILEEKGYFEKASNYFRKAIEISPDYAPGHLYLGIVFGMMNRNQEAVEELETVNRIDTDSEFAVMARKIIDQIKKNLYRK